MYNGALEGGSIYNGALEGSRVRTRNNTTIFTLTQNYSLQRNETFTFNIIYSKKDASFPGF